MPFSDHDQLRALLGESIPRDNGSESDTLFTNDQIDDLLNRHGSVTSSLGESWAIKAAIYADLVNTVEASSQRHMSDLYEHAARQARVYGWGENQVRCGSIVRFRGRL